MKTIEKEICNWTRNAMTTAGTYNFEVDEKKFSVRDKVLNVSAKKAFFYLWDSQIFIVYKNAVYFNFCGYRTNTTKSRINAYLSAFSSGYVCQKNYTLYYNGVTEIDYTLLYKVENGKIELYDYDKLWHDLHN